MSDLLTISEAGELLRVSRATMMRWLASGHIRGRKAGRKWLIARSEVERLLAPSAPVYRISREPWAPFPDWLEPLTEVEIHNTALALGRVLRAGGAPVAESGLSKLVTGQEPATALYWRYLYEGITAMERKLEAGRHPEPIDVRQLLDAMREHGEPSKTEEQPQSAPGKRPTRRETHQE